jgi:hypothetical protein
MTTAGKSGSGSSSKNQDQDNGNTGIEMEIETTRRLKVHGFAFEEKSIDGKGVISLSGNGIKDQELSEEEVSSFVRFFVGFQRRNDRGEDTVQDGRGQVTDASSDARLKGNEANRPNDPDRSKQSGRSSGK